MPAVGHPQPFPWATHDWSSTLIDLLRVESVLLSSGASFFPVAGAADDSRLTVDPDAAAWLDPGDEFPTDQVEGDSIKLTPKNLGIITGIDVEAVEDASVATLDIVGASLARAVATKLDARVFSTAAADKGPAGILGTFTPLAEALGVISILKAVATIQSKGGVPDTHPARAFAHQAHLSDSPWPSHQVSSWTGRGPTGPPLARQELAHLAEVAHATDVREGKTHARPGFALSRSGAVTGRSPYCTATASSPTTGAGTDAPPRPPTVTTWTTTPTTWLR
jgi:hypothetical protein